MRVYERFEHRVLVTLTSDSNFYTGLTCDLSLGGLFIATEQPLPLGSKVSFDLALITGKVTVPIAGTVRWLRAEEAPGLPAGMGIQFDELHPRVAKHIHALMARRDSIFWEEEDEEIPPG